LGEPLRAARPASVARPRLLARSRGGEATIVSSTGSLRATTSRLGSSREGIPVGVPLNPSGGEEYGWRLQGAPASRVQDAPPLPESLPTQAWSSIGRRPGALRALFSCERSSRTRRRPHAPDPAPSHGTRRFVAGLGARPEHNETHQAGVERLVPWRPEHPAASARLLSSGRVKRNPCLMGLYTRPRPQERRRAARRRLKIRLFYEEPAATYSPRGLPPKYHRR
jgi:hypothetical protein